MTDKYSYKGQDITLDIIMKIEKIISIICEKTGETFEEVLKNFMNLTHIKHFKTQNLFYGLKVLNILLMNYLENGKKLILAHVEMMGLMEMGNNLGGRMYCCSSCCC